MKKNYHLQKSPFIVPTDDNKYIAEHFGIATDGNQRLSIARMIAPPNWSEPFQTPMFDEYTLVLKGKKQCIVDNETVIVHAGESIKVRKDSRVQYANPFSEPCEYISVCSPAFSLETARREA